MGDRSGIAAALVGLSLLLTSGCPGRVTHDGPSLHLDGDDDQAVVGPIEPGHPLSLAGSTFTIAAWFLQEEGGDPYQRIVDRSDGLYGHDGWALSADAASGQIHLYAHDGRKGGDFVSRRRAYTTGTWHRVVAVARANRHEIWIDGRRDGGASYEDGSHALPAAVATELRIGTWNHDRGREWKGRLGEIAVWRRDLTPEEIGALFDERAIADVGASHLVGDWRPDEDTERTGVLRDFSGSRADARIVRSPQP